jgi:hypothetical protein
MPVEDPLMAPQSSNTSDGQNTPERTRLLTDIRPILCMAALVAVVWACFGRTLTSYFLADDFSEIHYVAQILNGKLSLLWSTLAGNYMQVPGMNVWRPWLLATLIFDYLIWGANAAGYYLSNLAYFTGDVLLLYLVARELMRSWPSVRRECAAFASALLFAVSPLHCESISWVVGRVDIVSCFFYLLSLYLLLRSRSWAGAGSTRPQRNLRIGLAVGSFWLGLLTKEMAIGLPLVATLIAFIWTPEPLASSPIRERLVGSLRFSAPLWIATIVYFPLRFLVLGTFVGGYVAGFGSSQLAAMAGKWLDPDTVARLFYPLNFTVFGNHSPYAQALTLCYLTAALVLVVRALSADISWRWLAFLAGWVVTTILPIYQLWGLGYDLEGSRFCFFLTMPLSFLLPVLLLAPAGRAGNGGAGGLSKKLSLIAAAAVLVLAAVLFKVAYKTNLVWVHAGKEVRAFAQRCRQLADGARSGTSFIILGIPKNHAGAHQILNGQTLATMLSPPFTAKDYSHAFLTFDPIMYGPAELINSTRLKSCLATAGVTGPFVWAGPARGFKLVPLGPSQGKPEPVFTGYSMVAGTWQPHSSGHAVYSVTGETLVMENVQDGDGLHISGLDLDPLDINFLVCEIHHSPEAVRPLVRVRWRGTVSEAPTQENAGASEPAAGAAEKQLAGCSGSHPARQWVRLSRYWRWFTCGRITEITLEFFPCRRLQISGIKFLPGPALLPTVRVAQLKPSPAGIYTYAGDHPLVLQVSERAMPGGTLEVQISKPNYFFANFPEFMQNDAVGKTLNFRPGTTSIQLDPSSLPATGFFEIRCRYVKPDGSPASDYSDPVTIHKGAR